MALPSTNRLTPLTWAKAVRPKATWRSPPADRTRSPTVENGNLEVSGSAPGHNSSCRFFFKA